MLHPIAFFTLLPASLFTLLAGWIIARGARFNNLELLFWCALVLSALSGLAAGICWSLGLL